MPRHCPSHVTAATSTGSISKRVIDGVSSGLIASGHSAPHHFPSHTAPAPHARPRTVCAYIHFRPHACRRWQNGELAVPFSSELIPPPQIGSDCLCNPYSMLWLGHRVGSIQQPSHEAPAGWEAAEGV